MWLYSSNIEFLKSFRVLLSHGTQFHKHSIPSQKEKLYAKYNTDSLNTLPKNQDKAEHLTPSNEKKPPVELSQDEKLHRRRWLESISDCV